MPYTSHQIYATLSELRHRAPLVHCLSNQVASNFTANVLLALGAVPAMVIDPSEVSTFAARADALSVNIGTLTSVQKSAIKNAVQSAVDAGRPWVLDPVAVGNALPLRSQFAVELVNNWRPTAIRANGSEVIALATILQPEYERNKGNLPAADVGGGRGPDSNVDSSEALEHAKSLALHSQSLVMLTGKQDFIVEQCSTSFIRLDNGHPLMAKVSGIGCALSASVAAFLAFAKSPDDRRIACLTALAVTAIAGELAAAESRGPGTFAVAYLDKLSTLSEKDLERQLRILD